MNILIGGDIGQDSKDSKEPREASEANRENKKATVAPKSPEKGLGVGMGFGSQIELSGFISCLQLCLFRPFRAIPSGGMGKLPPSTPRGDKAASHRDGSDPATVELHLRSLHLIQAIARSSPKLLHVHWVTLFPAVSGGKRRKHGPDTHPRSLLDLLQHHPDHQVKNTAAGALADMLVDSRQFLLAARPKTALGLSVVEIHKTLLNRIKAMGDRSGNSFFTVTKAMEVLVANAPFDKLSKGLLAELVTILRGLMSPPDPARKAQAVLSCLATALGTKVPDPALDELVRSGELITEFMNFGSGSLPRLVRIEALKAVTGAVTAYFPALTQSLEVILAPMAMFAKDKEETVRVAYLRILECLGVEASGEKAQSIPGFSELNIWNRVVQGLLDSGYLEDSFHSVRGSTLGCFHVANQAAVLSLPVELRARCLSSIAKAFDDKQNSVRAAAHRTAGAWICYHNACNDIDFLNAVSDAIVGSVDSTLGVRVRAVWVLANLFNTFFDPTNTERGLLSPEAKNQMEEKHFSRLSETLCDFFVGHDKLKANACRAFGHIAGTETLLKNPELRTRLLEAVMTNVGEAVPLKVQWNACYGLGKAFAGVVSKTLQEEPWAETAFKKLLLVIENSNNFKVQIAATHALGQLSTDVHYGVYLNPVWRAVISMHERLRLTGDDVEYTDIRYRNNLEAQLRATLVHVINCTHTEDLFVMGAYLVQKAPILQDMLRPTEEEKDDAKPEVSGKSSSGEDPEEDVQQVVIDVALRRKALVKILMLYHHQILYSAVAKCQREEERGVLGQAPEKLFSVYRGLSAVLSTDMQHGDDVVSESVLMAFQEASVAK